jgi:hypothetical protein
VALADRLDQGKGPSQHGTPCSIGELLQKLEGEELDAFREMMGTPTRRGWPASEIFDALVAEGHHVGYQQINKHRGGRCRCDKAAA